ncbi:MAG: mechanosensitive ion channel domain-containing protein [Synechococcales bacterium]|nr:mechanosensitive ion channel domain-containing protein [Synechococcales bacterium]
MNVTGQTITQTVEDFLRINSLDIPRPAIFMIFVIGAWLIGRYTPSLFRAIALRFLPHQFSEVFDNLVAPIKGAFRTAGTLILVYWSLSWLRTEEYQTFYGFIEPLVKLGVIVSIAWLVSRLFRQFIRIYGIDLLKRFGFQVDEMLLVVETIVNVLIGFIAALTFFNDFVGLLASLGIGGLAVAFAAQKILEQLLSTIVLYLDRPFVPGDYIRLSNGQLGRVESIGLRSTKIRASAKNTLFIVPNSNLISMELENITRAKKVMVLLYLDFDQRLDSEERALVQQVISETTDSVFGIDPGSTNIAFITDDGGKANRARITFFILGSNENSIQLRKRLLELANENLSKKLESFGITFRSPEPTVYVESPVTI